MLSLCFRANILKQERLVTAGSDGGQNKARLLGLPGVPASVLQAASVDFLQACADLLRGSPGSRAGRVGEKRVRAISRNRSTRQDNAVDARGSSIDDDDNPFSKNT